MKRFGKLALGALMLGGAALAAATPAAARVSIGIGIGVPGFGGYYDNPCAYPRYRYYHPGACGYPVYSEPVFIDGAWFGGPHYYRYSGGHRSVWYHNSWRSDFRGGHAQAHGGHWHHR